MQKLILLGYPHQFKLLYSGGPVVVQREFFEKQ